MGSDSTFLQTPQGARSPGRVRPAGAPSSAGCPICREPPASSPPWLIHLGGVSRHCARSPLVLAIPACQPAVFRACPMRADARDLFRHVSAEKSELYRGIMD